MLQVARRGLEKRGLGEGEYLAPLFDRQHSGRSPADEAGEIFSKGGVSALVAKRRL
jgi:hypothetical protein